MIPLHGSPYRSLDGMFWLQLVKRMFQEVGTDGKTNHSLRATGATRLFEANVPDKLIKEQTGHKSLDALRLYECTSSEQQNQYPI